MWGWICEYDDVLLIRVVEFFMQEACYLFLYFICLYHLVRPPFTDFQVFNLNFTLEEQLIYFLLLSLTPINDQAITALLNFLQPLDDKRAINSWVCIE